MTAAQILLEKVSYVGGVGKENVDSAPLVRESVSKGLVSVGRREHSRGNLSKAAREGKEEYSLSFVLHVPVVERISNAG